jgi:hypothetical protein
MGMEPAEIDTMKKLIEASRKKSMNFGFCLASSPEDSVLLLDRIKPVDTLVRNAKKSAGGTKVAFGTLETKGKIIKFNLYDAAPAGMKNGSKTFLKKNGLPFNVEIVEASAKPAPKGDKGKWESTKAALETLVDDSLSRVKNGAKLRATWAFALQKADEENYEAAISAAEKLKKELTTDIAAYAKSLFEKAMENYNSKSGVMTKPQRKELSTLLKSIKANLAKSSAKDVQIAFEGFDDKVNAAVEGLVKGQSDIKAKTAKLAAEIKELKATLVVAKIDGLKKNLAKAEADFDASVKKGGIKKDKMATKVAKFEKLKETTNADIAAKIAETNKLNENVQEQIDALKSALATSQAEQPAKLQAIQDKLDKVKAVVKTENFKKDHAAIEDKIKELAEASVWQSEEVERAADDGNHGTGRHGAQTGVERQARRAATYKEDAADPHKSDALAPDSASNQSGTTQHIKTWKGAKIEWEQGSDGKRKVKSRTPVQKQVVTEVGKTLAKPQASSFANPVLEKEAVETAISLMDAKGWNEIYSNAKGWHDLTSATLAVGPPKNYKSWGYALERKAIAALAITRTNEIMDEFEKGKINEKEMLEKMGVHYVLDDDKKVKQIPYATVVLTRADGSSKWQSKTHYPNGDKTAQELDLQKDKRRVRKTGGAEEVAAL